MPIEVRLPQLGETMAEGVIVELFAQTGDQIKKCDVIYEIETDKATLEVESPADGFVKCVIAKLGQTLKVGEPVMILADKNEQIPQNLIDSLKAEHTEVVNTSAGQIAPEFEAADDEPLEQTPPPDLSQAKLGDTIPLSRIQKITGQRMLRSKREIPCFYLNARADFTELVQLRTELNETADVKISYNDFLMKALAISMEKFPIMTASLLAGEAIVLPGQINIGLSVETPNGLVVPVIKNVGQKDVAQIARDVAGLVEKARTNKLLLTDLEGACITVSNLGPFGVDSFIPVAVPGQCSILGVGQIIDTAVPQIGGEPVLRKVMSLTLSVDHRIANGAYAAQFLDFVRKALEDIANFT